jgi:hypothetical protein
MRVEARDLEHAFGGQGGRFEEFIAGLVRAAARACGVNPNAVDWDPRTNVKDGGQDLVVRAGNPRGPGHFIPEQPSIWSVKSGADGVNPKKLRQEVLPQQKKDHPEVRAALKAGRVYVWCAVHPVGQGKRDEMRAAADAIAAELGVSPDLIRFWWQDQLADEANRFPNLIPVHLPEVDTRWAGVLTLREWQREEPGLTTPWAEFGSRAALVRRVADHLLGRGAPNVLHVAGLSGIGKTRTVLEACVGHPELQGVFYLPRHADLSRTIQRALEDSQGAFLVIDETSLEEADVIRGKFGGADHVRIVTIGPAGRQRSSPHNDVLLVPEPQTEDEVLAVIRGPGAGLPDAVLRSIAARSAHDLRLALLLVRATLRTPDLRALPVVHPADVWDRLMRLFRSEVRDPAAFRQGYEALSVAVDVGYVAEYRPELRLLAGYFGLAEDHLLDCLNAAADCGLGRRAGRFFEPTPHALAVGLFRDVFRRRLRDRLPEFMGVLPDRLLRRFLERCQELPDDAREEVADAVGRTFSAWLTEADMTALTGREASRVFKAWAEFDPARGLAWLRRAVEAATPDQLLALGGGGDGSGGWRGRRQLVWLCENLAGFADHFAACEAVLYRLARNESEPGIGNNATAVWRSLFWPVLTPTELPFEDRLPALMRRLRSATPDDLPLVLGAAFGAIEPPMVGLGLPPRTVGGRLTPGPWMPATSRQLWEYRRTAATQVLDAVAGLSGNVRDLARREVIRQVGRFGYLDLVDEVRALFPPADLPDDLRRALVVELDQQIGFHRRWEREDRRPAPDHVPQLDAWRAELAAGDLATRVRDLTAREYHDVFMEEQSDTAYHGPADELRAAPDVFRGLRDWFGADAAKGAAAFGFCLGRRDADDRLADPVREWLLADRARPLVTGYLNGAASRDGRLPDRWAAALDAASAPNPELAVLATATADVGPRGLDRILAALDRLPAPAPRFLRGLAFNGWQERLPVADQGRALAAVAALAEAGDTAAPAVGMWLAAFWWHDRPAFDPALVPVAFRLAALAPAAGTRDGVSDWHRVLRLLCPHDPGRVAELVVGVMTDQRRSWWLDDGNVEVLGEAACHDPDRVMDAVGRAVLDPARRGIFGVAVFEGLFEAVGPDIVRRWVEAHGPEALRWVARHLDSPSVGPSGEVVIPPLTRWLFTDREDDQEAFVEFLAGRSRGAFVLEAGLGARRRVEMAPFLVHPLRRVREWAEYEVRDAERHEAWSRRDDEEDGRR